MGSCAHPCIPALLDILEQEGKTYEVLEYKSGETLKTYLKKQIKISKIKFLKIGIQLIEILLYLHERDRPVLYLNWTLDNVLLYESEISLTGFSGALFLADAAALGEVHEKDDISALYALLNQLGNYADGCEEFMHVLEDEAAPRRIKAVFEGELLSEREDDAGGVHFAKKIAVIGSGTGVGVTHTAISLTSYLCHRTKAYMELDKSMVNSILGYDRTAVLRKGVLYCGEFEGRQRSLSEEQDRETVVVKDLGEFSGWDQELENCDLIYAILGVKPWELESAKTLYDRLKYAENVRFLAAFGNVSGGRKCSRLIKRPVHVMPMDHDPFILTQEKQDFFQQLSRERR
mgnify:CR=1 FL=1